MAQFPILLLQLHARHRNYGSDSPHPICTKNLSLHWLSIYVVVYGWTNTSVTVTEGTSYVADLNFVKGSANDFLELVLSIQDEQIMQQPNGKTMNHMTL